MYFHHTNPTAVRSQHMIADALFSLMKRKPFQQITITELCNEAAIGRKTFYRNFEMKEDVVDFQIDLLREQYRVEIQGMSLDEQLRHHMEFVRRNNDCFISLYHNGFSDTVRKKFSVLLPETMPTWTDDPVEQQYRSAYIVAGIEAIERVWVERRYCENIDKVVEFARHAQDIQIPLDR